MNKISFKFNNNEWEFINEHIKYNLYSNKQITVFVDNFPTYEKKENDIWIYLQVESTLITGYYINYLINDDSLFDIILTWDINLLQKKKSIKFMSNNKVYWVSPTLELNYNLNLPNNNIINYSYQDKKFQISMLCGGKNWCPGHILRRQYWENQDKINIPKKFIYGQNYVDLKIFDNNFMALHSKDKTELFIDSMFHIAIENNKAPNYFSEKLIDCIVTKTIPIYYGCPNISDYFNINGIIIIDSIDDISLINNLNEQVYNDKKQYVEENYRILINLPSFKEQFINIISNNYDKDIIEQ